MNIYPINTVFIEEFLTFNGYKAKYVGEKYTIWQKGDRTVDIPHKKILTKEDTADMLLYSHLRPVQLEEFMSDMPEADKRQILEATAKRPSLEK